MILIKKNIRLILFSRIFFLGLSKIQQDIYPIIHLLPGINEIIFVVMRQQMNVLTAMHGMAATVGSSSVVLNTVTHNPSQNICMRYMP